MLSGGLGQVGREGEVPVLHAVLDQALVKWIVEFAIQILEVPVATRIGLLVGGHVSDDHLELHTQVTHIKRKYTDRLLRTSPATLPWGPAVARVSPWELTGSLSQGDKGGVTDCKQVSCDLGD